MQVVNYRSALEQRNRRIILENLANAGGEKQFLKLRDETELPQDTFEHHLAILTRNNIISVVGDTVRLERKTPLCYIFDSPNIPYIYLGLLGGERKERSEAETETALKLLQKENLQFSRVTVFTTEKGKKEWEGVAPQNVEWKLLEDREIRRIETIESKVEANLADLVKNYIVVMDCTCLTKPATIAYYKIASKHNIPLIYVYEDRKELTWILSREDLKKKLLPPQKQKEKVREKTPPEEARHIKIYQNIFKGEKERWKRALENLASDGKSVGIRDLGRRAGVKPNTLTYIIKSLKGKGIVTYIPKLCAELTHKTPLCYIFGSKKVPYAYLGLLGKREGRSEAETQTAQTLLKEEIEKQKPPEENSQKGEVTFDMVIVFESYKYVSEWEGVAPKNIYWRLLDDEEITSVETIETKVEEVLKELIRTDIVIMDCTGLTKPATIAYYKLAEKYQVPLVYVYEDEKELTWLISKEDLKKQLLAATEKEQMQD
ncbi:MAG: hypothetical protein Q6366_003540 [Candidatus Freyarchaeota archaeon]